MLGELIFDTRFAGDGFDFQSVEFPQGNVAAVDERLERGGVSHLVDLIFEPHVAFLRSRRRWTTREDAERALARFLNQVEASGGRL